MPLKKTTGRSPKNVRIDGEGGSMTDIKERGDQMEEDCGVFGIYAQD